MAVKDFKSHMYKEYLNYVQEHMIKEICTDEEIKRHFVTDEKLYPYMRWLVSLDQPIESPLEWTRALCNLAVSDDPRFTMNSLFMGPRAIPYLVIATKKYTRQEIHEHMTQNKIILVLEGKKP